VTSLPLNTELEVIARRVIWFEEPEQSLGDSNRFLAYAMTYASFEDMTAIRKYVTDDELREALQNAPPGVIDPRSWSYWHLKLGQFPAPAMPTRQL
jgi:hypothetical protein